METYIYQADILCKDCGGEARRDLNAEAVAALRGQLQGTGGDIPDPDTYEADSEAWARKHPRTLAKALGFDPENESAYDSGNYPKGPYPDGGGEADSPQNCVTCGAFLENRLTEDGFAYLIDALLDHLADGDGNHAVLHTWWDFYRDLWFDATASLDQVTDRFDAMFEDSSADYGLTPIRFRDRSVTSPSLAPIGDLIIAAQTLADHALEMYPHFESERGQVDIQRVRAAIEAVRGAS